MAGLSTLVARSKPQRMEKGKRFGLVASVDVIAIGLPPSLLFAATPGDWAAV